jgi:transposase-like protein
MDCVDCGSVATSERRDRTAQGYRRFRCRDCGRQFNERSGGVLNRTQYPSDVIALVVLWRLRYRLTLRDLSEMFLERGIRFSHETVREWEAKLTPILTAELRQRRRGKSGAGCCSWFVDETYLRYWQLNRQWNGLGLTAGRRSAFWGHLAHVFWHQIRKALARARW